MGGCCDVMGSDGGSMLLHPVFFFSFLLVLIFSVFPLSFSEVFVIDEKKNPRGMQYMRTLAKYSYIIKRSHNVKAKLPLALQVKIILQTSLVNMSSYFLVVFCREKQLLFFSS